MRSSSSSGKPRGSSVNCCSAQPPSTAIHSPGRAARTRAESSASASLRVVTPSKRSSSCSAARIQCEWLSMSPGITVRPRSSITFVAPPASLRMSALAPTATMRCPLIATACAIVKRSSTVTILPPTRIVSAISAAKTAVEISATNSNNSALKPPAITLAPTTPSPSAPPLLGQEGRLRACVQLRLSAVSLLVSRRPWRFSSSVDLFTYFPHDPRRRRNHVILQRVRGGQGYVRRRDAHDRPVEIPEALVGDDRGDLGAPAAQARVLLDRHEAAGPGYFRQYVLGVERHERAHVDHRAGDAVLLLERLRRLQRPRDHGGERDDGAVLAAPQNVGFAQRDHVLAVGHLAFHGVER